MYMEKTDPMEILRVALWYYIPVVSLCLKYPTTTYFAF